MVAEVDLKQACGFGEPDRQASISVARCRIAAGMIVDEDEAVGVAEDGGAENFARVGDAFREAAEGDFFDADEVQPRIEENDAQAFLFKLPEFRAEEFVDELRPVHGRADERLAGEPSGKTECGCELNGFGKAEAFDFLQLRDAGAGKVAEAAKSPNQVTTEVDCADAFHPDAKQDGDEFAVAQRVCSVFLELLARTLVFRQFLDARGCALLAAHAYKSSFFTGATDLPAASPLAGMSVSFE